MTLRWEISSVVPTSAGTLTDVGRPFNSLQPRFETDLPPIPIPKCSVAVAMNNSLLISLAAAARMAQSRRSARTLTQSRAASVYSNEREDVAHG